MDVRVIAMIGQMDKTQTERVLEGEHALLRELGRMYEAFGQAVVRARCRLHDLLRKLFCDLEKGKRFVFSNTGGAVAGFYGWKAIVAMMRKLCKMLYGLANPDPCPFRSLQPNHLRLPVCSRCEETIGGQRTRGHRKSEASKVRLLTRRYSNCTALRLDIYPNIYPMVRSG